jgi:DNA-binding MarR family transcriptional regulator
MLLAIEQLLRERRSMSLKDLSVHFDAEPAALEPMLARLVAKGRVRKISLTDDATCRRRCAGCASACGPDAVAYEWIA